MQRDRMWFRQSAELARIFILPISDSSHTGKETARKSSLPSFRCGAWGRQHPSSRKRN